MKDSPLVVEHTFHLPTERVWKALCDKSEMKNWYFDLKEFKPEVGFMFQFTGGPSPEKQYTHLCEVTEVIPNKKLTYSWSYQGYPGKSFVTFELKAQGSRTILTLTHSGLETFPKENPDFARKNFEGGWNDIIHKLLKEYLES